MYVLCLSGSCAGLFHLAANDDNRTLIARRYGGMYASAVAAMQKHPDEATVQQYACGILMHLTADARDNGVNKVLSAYGRGIHCIIAAMKRHPTECRVQENGCGAIGNLAESKSLCSISAFWTRDVCSVLDTSLTLAHACVLLSFLFFLR
jgi:hypothetical protein